MFYSITYRNLVKYWGVHPHLPHLWKVRQFDPGWEKFHPLRLRIELNGMKIMFLDQKCLFGGLGEYPPPFVDNDFGGYGG